MNILPSLPRILAKLLKNMEQKEKERLEIGKRSVELLSIFIKEFEQPSNRTVLLDHQIVDNLLKYLLEKKGAPIEPSIIEALMWLKKFLAYFKADYEQWSHEEDAYLRQQSEEQKAEGAPSQSKKFIDGVFKQQFPLVIKVILGYSGLMETRDDRPNVIQSINETLQEFVLNTLKAKRGDFEQIFNELKTQYNNSKASVSAPLSSFCRRKRRS